MEKVNSATTEREDSVDEKNKYGTGEVRKILSNQEKERETIS